VRSTHCVVPANGSGYAGPMTGFGGDPYSVSFVLKKNVASSESNHNRQGLWVPAFAGTTRGEATLNPPPAVP
jgi:hypothetical protein